MSTALMYSPCETCTTKQCSICEITYRKARAIEPDVRYCKYCFNARIDEKYFHGSLDVYDECLTDDNDFSSHSIGHSHKPCSYSLMLNAGNGVPVNIEGRHHDDTCGWYTVLKYYPKYCPECGRRLNEYKAEAEHGD